MTGVLTISVLILVVGLQLAVYRAVGIGLRALPGFVMAQCRQFLALADGPDGLQARIVPILSYVALVAILIKLTVF